MSNSSRRGFLKVAAAGAAAAGAAAVVPAVTKDAGASTESKPTALPRSAHGALVAHVADVRSGQLSIMVEGHEVTVTDHDLVARIAQAMHSATPTSV